MRRTCPRFDAWYAAEHLPDAKRAFGARRALALLEPHRPTVHCAFYEFPDAAAAEAAIASPALRALVAEFDRVWGSERDPDAGAAGTRGRALARRPARQAGGHRHAQQVARRGDHDHRGIAAGQVEDPPATTGRVMAATHQAA